MKFIQYFLHGVFILVNSYAIVIAWKLEGFTDMIKHRDFNEQLSALLDNAGPFVVVSLVILTIVHLLINKRLNGDYRAGNILLFLLADLIAICLLTALGIHL